MEIVGEENVNIESRTSPFTPKSEACGSARSLDQNPLIVPFCPICDVDSKEILTSNFVAHLMEQSPRAPIHRPLFSN
jgi:hypothetical protein